MNGAHSKALIQRAVETYPTMLRMLLSAMRTHQRNDEPARDSTNPAVVPMAMACVLAIRMTDEPDALELAETLMAGGLAMLSGTRLPDAAAMEKAADVLRRLEEGGAI